MIAERTWEISDIDGSNKRAVTLAQFRADIDARKAMAAPIMAAVKRGDLTAASKAQAAMRTSCAAGLLMIVASAVAMPAHAFWGGGGDTGPGQGATGTDRAAENHNRDQIGGMKAEEDARRAWQNWKEQEKRNRRGTRDTGGDRADVGKDGPGGDDDHGKR